MATRFTMAPALSFYKDVNKTVASIARYSERMPSDTKKSLMVL